MAAKAHCAQDCATNRLSMQKIIPQPPARRNAQQRHTGKLCGKGMHLIAGQLHGGCNLRERFSRGCCPTHGISIDTARQQPARYRQAISFINKYTRASKYLSITAMRFRTPAVRRYRCLSGMHISVSNSFSGVVFGEFQYISNPGSLNGSCPLCGNHMPNSER